MKTVQCERCRMIQKIDGRELPSLCKRSDQIGICGGDLEIIETSIENDWRVWGAMNVDEFRTIKSEFAVLSIMESWAEAQHYLAKKISEKTGHSVDAVLNRVTEKNYPF